MSALGLNNPRIEGMVQPYSINHNVTKGENAVNDCKACHNEDSRMTQSIKLADHAPVMPVFDADNNVNGSGEIVTGADGALYYQPVPANDKMYVFGSSRVSWIDWLGALALRWLTLRRARSWDAEILLVEETAQGSRQRPSAFICTNRIAASGIGCRPHPSSSCSSQGLIIHRPDIFGVFSFRWHGDCSQRHRGHPGGQRCALALLSPRNRSDSANSSRIRTASSMMRSFRQSITSLAFSKAKDIRSRNCRPAA